LYEAQHELFTASQLQATHRIGSPIQAPPTVIMAIMKFHVKIRPSSGGGGGN
jgi:hypothetical protein